MLQAIHQHKWCKNGNAIKGTVVRRIAKRMVWMGGASGGGSWGLKHKKNVKAEELGDGDVWTRDYTQEQYGITACDLGDTDKDNELDLIRLLPIPRGHWNELDHRRMGCYNSSSLQTHGSNKRWDHRPSALL